MKHLDEGTIHAWLDGALNTAQSVEVEAHVKSCAECSAKVAEARGLIAASSRILLSLDDTPANVIPKKAPVAPRRQWRAAPWVSGLAAAVVIFALWRTGGVESPRVAVRDTAIPPITSLETKAEPTLQPVPPAAPVAIERRQAKVANTPQVAIGRASGAGAVGGASGVAASDLASAQSALAPTAARSPAESIRTMMLREDAQRREANASEAMRRSRIDSIDNTKLRGVALKDEALAVVGCYRIADLPKFDAVVTGVAEARAPEKAARARGAVASAAPAPAAMQKNADADVSSGTLVRLDAQGLVRAIGSDSIIGAWDHYRADSARVRFGSRTPYVSNLSKVRCP